MKRLKTRISMALGIFLLAGAIGSLFSGNALAGPYYLPLVFNRYLEWPIANEVFTTAEQQILPIGLSADTPKINPKDVALYDAYGYSHWQTGAGLAHVKRAELAPGYANAPNAARLLSFFSSSDVHIADKESPAQANYVGWNAPYGTASQYLQSDWSPVFNSTTQVLDAAVRTINVLHNKTHFDFGIFLGDAANNTQYNELRWYIDVLDGKAITPSSGAHLGADTIDYQKPYQAAGLDKSIPWYQAIGNHDQFCMGAYYEFEKTLSAHVGANLLNCSSDCPANFAGIRQTGTYMGVVDGSTYYGEVIKAGPQESFSTPPTVVPDEDRRSLVADNSTSRNWMREFLTTSSNPVGHGFNQTNVDNDITYYSFHPKADLPIKIIVFDDTCKGSPTDTTANYAAGCLDQTRTDWLKAELQESQGHDQLMIIAAHVPLKPQTSNEDPTPFPLFAPGVEDSLLTTLHTYPNLILWIAGHRHLNVVTPQPYNPATPGQGPENSFWLVETASLRDFPQQFRTFEIRRNSDQTISILTTNIDPAVSAGSPASKSRGYAIGSARIFGATDAIRADASSHAYNAELVKQLTARMQTIIANYGTPVE